MKIVAMLFGLLVFFSSVVVLAQETPAPALSPEFKKYLSSEKRSVVFGSRLIDEGRFPEAVSFLQLANQKYLRNDVLLFNLGVAYYESAQLTESEQSFMDAIQANPLNDNAIAYVNAIRAINTASTSESMQQLQEVGIDKLGDIAVFALGFLVGSAANAFFGKIREKQFIFKSRRTFLAGQYEDFADLLEIQLVSNELQLLRESLIFMTEHKSIDECIRILEDYVNSEANLNTLMRMLKLNAAHRT